MKTCAIGLSLAGHSAAIGDVRTFDENVCVRIDGVGKRTGVEKKQAQRRLREEPSSAVVRTFSGGQNVFVRTGGTAIVLLITVKLTYFVNDVKSTRRWII